MREPPPAMRHPAGPALALLAWALAWAAMLALDGRVDRANQAMLLVLAAAVATLWLPIARSLLLTALSVLAFNWLFVPPRHAFSVDLRQDAVLLGAMLAVSWIVAAVVARQRVLAQSAQRHARHAEQLRRLGDALRDLDEMQLIADALQSELATLLGSPPSLLLRLGVLSETNTPVPAQPDADAHLTGEAPGMLWCGTPSADEQAGLWHCLRQGEPFGPGTGRHEDLPQWYLPLRGSHEALGAAVFTPKSDRPSFDDALRVQAQALCDLAGQRLQRAQALAVARADREQAQGQEVRNALLAAISHDYRTPLAAIMGAASSLRDQAERLAPAQREQLARSIVEEVTQLSRLTDNTLQLARLDAPGVRIRSDWESAEEIVGAVVRRARAHDRERRMRARLEPGLPLVRCDPLLMAQLLDNLVDNALKYSAAPAPVELLVQRRPGHVVFAVRDRGPGVEPAWRERVFEVFTRGRAASNRPFTSADATGDVVAGRGAGVGLAVCRAIARAHGGELRLRARAHGGASFECWLPESVEPASAPDDEPASATPP